jgi:hypothetical protein
MVFGVVVRIVEAFSLGEVGGCGSVFFSLLLPYPRARGMGRKVVI